MGKGLTCKSFNACYLFYSSNVNLRIKDTMRPAIMSTIEMLSWSKYVLLQWEMIIL